MAGDRCASRRRGRPLVASPTQEHRQLVLDRPLEDELGAQPSDLAEGIGSSRPSSSTRSIASSIRMLGGYPSVHGVVSFCELPGPLRSLRRRHFYSGVRTPPWNWDSTRTGAIVLVDADAAEDGPLPDSDLAKVRVAVDSQLPRALLVRNCQER